MKNAGLRFGAVWKKQKKPQPTPKTDKYLCRKSPPELTDLC